MTLKDVRNIFKPVLPGKVFHYFASGQTGNYITWSEESKNDLINADDVVTDKKWQGTVDVFTKDEYDSITDQLETAMTKGNLYWKLNSTQYEKDTGYIHYEYVWEALI